jgi:hypothetical protein
MIGAIRIVVVVALAIAATLAANFVLMGVATGQQDPVGRLAPRSTGGGPVAPAHRPSTTRATAPHEPAENHLDD